MHWRLVNHSQQIPLLEDDIDFISMKDSVFLH